ncbi:MAG: elongation factor EF-2 [Candidatus Micrarchaeaceae archaeon]
MVRRELMVEEITKLMNDYDRIRNIAIIAHVHHGKTTLTDSLLAKAGLISKTAAGEVLFTNYDAIEKERKMTIKSANISLGFKYKDRDYIINLIDTPGHVDFGGHVTRSMRAVDGAVLVVDPVEMIMPQTETVLKQALKEKVRPILFVNKVDRLLSELRLTPEQTQERLLDLVQKVNYFIEQFAPPEFIEKWKISVENNSVAFGSAYDKWAVSKVITEKYKITFKDIFRYFAEGKESELQDVAPIEEAILPMIIDNLPNPKEAQPYRIPLIWHGDINSEDGKAMINVDPTAKTNIVVFGITYDQHSGEVAVGRVFSGVAKKGVELHISGKNNTERIQQVGVYMGPDRVPVDAVPAGNICTIVGLGDLTIGDTLSENIIEPFDPIKHYSKPVVTKAIEAKDSRDTIKLIEALRELSKEDPTIQAEINQETGEHLVSGMGELHLEIIETKIKDEFGIPIISSEPIVVYSEAIASKAGPIESKTPNRHSKFYLTVEPLPEALQKELEEGAIKDGKPKGQAAIELMVKAGLDRAIAKNAVYVYNRCILSDVTHGVQYINEVMENVIEGFTEAVKDGPLARQKCAGVLVSIVDATIHEDPVHRGPAQVIPAIRNGIYAAMLTAGVYLMEPKQIYEITVPQDYMSDVISFMQGKRGVVLDIKQDREQVIIRSKIPVAETLKNFSNDLRSLTQGRALWAMEFAGYEKVPNALQEQIVREIRKRKGVPETPPKASDFLIS